MSDPIQPESDGNGHHGQPEIITEKDFANDNADTISEELSHGDEESEIGHDGPRAQDLTKTPTNTSQKSAMARTLSLVRTRESGKDIGPPPDGGAKAWMQVLFAHLVIMNT